MCQRGHGLLLLNFRCAIAALLNGNLDIAKLLKDILQFQNNHGIFQQVISLRKKIFYQMKIQLGQMLL